MSGRCTLVIPDAGPLNSLWVADALPLLLELAVPIVVVDAVYDEVTGDPVHYAKDRDVKAFIDAQVGGVIEIATTFVGTQARRAQAEGAFVPGKGLGDAAIAEFVNAGLNRYLTPGDVALLLFEDVDFRNIHFLRQPDNLHLLSTVALVRGLQEVGVLPSADAVLNAMTNPTAPGRQGYARHLRDWPTGTDLPARRRSTWKPVQDPD